MEGGGVAVQCSTWRDLWIAVVLPLLYKRPFIAAVLKYAVLHGISSPAVIWVLAWWKRGCFQIQRYEESKSYFCLGENKFGPLQYFSIPKYHKYKILIVTDSAVPFGISESSLQGTNALWVSPDSKRTTLFSARNWLRRAPLLHVGVI